MKYPYGGVFHCSIRISSAVQYSLPTMICTGEHIHTYSFYQQPLSSCQIQQILLHWRPCCQCLRRLIDHNLQIRLNFALRRQALNLPTIHITCICIHEGATQNLTTALIAARSLHQIADKRVLPGSLLPGAPDVNLGC